MRYFSINPSKFSQRMVRSNPWIVFAVLGYGNVMDILCKKNLEEVNHENKWTKSLNTNKKTFPTNMWIDVCISFLRLYFIHSVWTCCWLSQYLLPTTRWRWWSSSWAATIFIPLKGILGFRSGNNWRNINLFQSRDTYDLQIVVYIYNCCPQWQSWKLLWDLGMFPQCI